MEHNLIPLIADLALILFMAACTTLLFKWMKQPVVLGYIVAGFLASTQVSYLPTVSSMENIEFWAQIGIIVLLFSLGLEFSFKKLVNVGGSAIISVIVIVTGMMSLGILTGHLLNFTWINSIFLGAMLSMSSTTIILKALTDLRLRKQKFTTVVFGVLIVEDMFAVVMMVLLSSIAVNNTLEGASMLYSILKLMFFLVIWYVVGVYVLPTFLNRNKSRLNDETLLILSMGLCLGMVVLATYSGFSAALGAFVMGSILAGTNYAEKIEKVVAPVKDLFGAIFFISVGMLVNLSVLVDYFVPIIIISGVVIFGQIIFSSLGLTISGQPLKIAIQSGFSLAQIGEFAFIIAVLGMSLNVIEPYLYPIVVAVSVITTFTTPYLIKLSNPVANYLDRVFPQRARSFISRYSLEASSMDRSGSWGGIFKAYFGRISIYAVILIAITLIAKEWFLPFLSRVISNENIADFTFTIITLVAMLPFLWGLMLKSINNKKIRVFIYEKQLSPVPIICISIIRVIIGYLFMLYVLMMAYSVVTAILVSLFISPLFLLISSKQINDRLRYIEEKFFNNLNERELRRSGKNNNLVHNMHIAQMEVMDGSPLVGMTLLDANIRKKYGVNIISIRRGDKRFDMPKGNACIFPNDILSVVGRDYTLQNFLSIVEVEDETDTVYDNSPFELGHYKIREGSPFEGVTVIESQLRENNCLIVGVESEDGDFFEVTGDTKLNLNDTIWIVGEHGVMQRIIKH